MAQKQTSSKQITVSFFIDLLFTQDPSIPLRLFGNFKRPEVFHILFCLYLTTINRNVESRLLRCIIRDVLFLCTGTMFVPILSTNARFRVRKKSCTE